MDLIPHRAPFLLVDRVIESGDGRVLAEKRLSAGDPLAGDELPDVLVIEALAQAAACTNAGTHGAHRGMLVAASGFTFEGRARAGDTLVLEAVRVAKLGALLRFDGTASVDGRLIAKGQMTFAVEPV